MNIDYSLKSYVLKSGLYNYFLDFKKALYEYYKNYNYSNVDIERSILGCAKNTACNTITLIFLKKFENLYNNGDYSLLGECFKIYNSNKQRTLRLKKRISNMLEKPCLFLTLTFNNVYLSKTTFSSRRVAISRFLKQFNVPYVANVDFGAQNEREHYHAVIQLEHIDYSLYSFGAINGKKIYLDDNLDCVSRVAKYVAKLTNHAIKNTTKRCALLYSR